MWDWNHPQTETRKIARTKTKSKKKWKTRQSEVKRKRKWGKHTPLVAMPRWVSHKHVYACETVSIVAKLDHLTGSLPVEQIWQVSANQLPCEGHHKTWTHRLGLIRAAEVTGHNGLAAKHCETSSKWTSINSKPPCLHHGIVEGGGSKHQKAILALRNHTWIPQTMENARCRWWHMVSLCLGSKSCQKAAIEKNCIYFFGKFRSNTFLEKFLSPDRGWHPMPQHKI